MSDSEADDAWKAVLLSRTKLNEVKQRLRNLEEDDQFTKNNVDLVRLRDFTKEMFRLIGMKVGHLIYIIRFKNVLMSSMKLII